MVFVKKILLIILINIPVFVNAQSVTVKVLNDKTEFPVINAAVYSPDKSVGTITDFNGTFDLTIFEKYDTIWISHAAFKPVALTRKDLKKLRTALGTNL